MVKLFEGRENTKKMADLKFSVKRAVTKIVKQDGKDVEVDVEKMNEKTGKMETVYTPSVEVTLPAKFGTVKGLTDALGEEEILTLGLKALKVLCQGSLRSIAVKDWNQATLQAAVNSYVPKHREKMSDEEFLRKHMEKRGKSEAEIEALIKALGKPAKK